MANKIDVILNQGIQKKKKKSEIQAVLLANNVDLTTASSKIGELEKAGWFDYEQEQESPQVNGQQKFQEAMTFAKENMNSEDVNMKTRANKFLMDVEAKKILPNGYKVENDEVAALLDNPQQWNELTASVKGELMPELAKAGFKFPRKLTGEQVKAQQNAEAGIVALQDMRSEVFDENGEIRRGNLIQEKLPFAIGARKLRSQIQSVIDPISRIRSGAALTDQEVKFYGDMAPSPQDSTEDAKYKMEQLEVFFSGMAGNEIKLKNDEGKIVKYDDMFDPRQRSEVRKAMQNGYNVFHGGDFDITYGETIVDGDPVQEMSRQAVANEEPQQIQDQGKNVQPEKKGFLTKVGEGLGSFFGGDKVGDALGNVVGGRIAKFGKAGEEFAQQVAMVEQRFQEGKYSQEQYDDALENLDEQAKSSFGYDGPGAKQIAGDLGKIGMNFVGGAALKGATGAAKLAGLGKLAGTGALAVVADSMADDEEITSGKVATGAALAGGLGIAGKTIGKGTKYVTGKLDEATDFSGRANKLAAEILQPSKKEAQEAIQKGNMPKAITALVNNVKQSKDFTELRGHLGGTTEALFEERNRIMEADNFDVTAKYLKPLRDKIRELEKNKLASPEQIDRMKTILQREHSYLKEVGGNISRLDAQERKQAIQDLTQPLLKKKNAGNLAENEATDKTALDAIRQGLREAVEGGDTKIKEINGQYEGLKRAQDLISGREALALKAEDQTLLQKVASPIIELMTAGTGAGSAAFVARRASQQQAKLSTLTKKLEKLSQDKGGVFTEFYETIKNSSIGKQGKIGNMLDDIDEWTDSVIEKKKRRK